MDKPEFAPPLAAQAAPQPAADVAAERTPRSAKAGAKRRSASPIPRPSMSSRHLYYPCRVCTIRVVSAATSQA